MNTPEMNVPDRGDVQRQEAAMEKKNKWMYPVVITVLSVIFAAGFLYGIQLVLNMEGAFPPVVLAEGKTPAPETNAELAAYLNGVLTAVKTEKPAAAYEWKFRVDDGSVTTDGTDALKNTLVFLTDPAEDYVSGQVEKQSAVFGESLAALDALPALTEAEIESFTCDYIFYRCGACGQESAGPLDACDVCGSDRPYDMQYRDRYTFTVVLADTPALAERLISPAPDAVKDMVIPALAEFASLNGVASENTGLSIRFVTDRFTDRLLSLSVIKDVNAAAGLEFIGDFAALGAVECGAAVSEEAVFSFTWPAIVLNKHGITLAPGKKEQLTAERVCDDPKAYAITWRSSDENIVTVDDKGFLKAGKTAGTADVTASYEFMGKTYTDTCAVNVKISVEYIQISKHKLTLSVGNTETLTARVAADNKGFALKKPTVQTVSWHTTNETVAAVDAAGKVTAVGPGACTVYALSDDGYYRASCEVTVNE